MLLGKQIWAWCRYMLTNRLVRFRMSRASQLDVGQKISEPMRLSTAMQWRRLEHVVLGNDHRTQSVIEMQDSARLHLDAAHYALDRMVVELADLIPSIANMAGSIPPGVIPLHSKRAVTPGTVEVDRASPSIAA